MNQDHQKLVQLMAKEIATEVSSTLLATGMNEAGYPRGERNVLDKIWFDIGVEIGNNSYAIAGGIYNALMDHFTTDTEVK